MAATGTPTPNLGLRIPQGTDPASVDDINYNSNLLDTKIGAVGNDSVQDQIDSLNSKINVETITATINETIAGNGMKDCVVDISTLKQTYSKVYFLCFEGANGSNYTNFGFMFAYSASSSTYNVGVKNYSSSAQTLGSFGAKFLCIKE